MLRNMPSWNTAGCFGACRLIANACSDTGTTRAIRTPDVLPNMKPK